MMTRSAKLLLVAGIALYYTLVVFNNLTDFNSNYEFIQHVLSMDSTLSGQSRDVARNAVARNASRFLLDDHRLGVRDDACLRGGGWCVLIRAFRGLRGRLSMPGNASRWLRLRCRC